MTTERRSRKNGDQARLAEIGPGFRPEHLHRVAAVEVEEDDLEIREFRPASKPPHQQVRACNSGDDIGRGSRLT